MSKTHSAILLLIAAGLLVAAGRPAPGQVAIEEDRSDAGDNPIDRLPGELGSAAVSQEQNPLLEIARQMREVEGRMAQNDSGTTTRKVQQQIIADLDALIADARKRARQGKPGDGQSQSSGPQRPVGQPPQQPDNGGGTPTDKPATASTPRTDNGEPREPDVKMMRRVMEKLWEVDLPPHVRQQMMEVQPEEFLPKYETMIEEYFRRLSQQRGWQDME